jgi:hypothetical protein
MVALEVATSFRRCSQRGPLSEDTGDNLEIRRKVIGTGSTNGVAFSILGVVLLNWSAPASGLFLSKICKARDQTRLARGLAATAPLGCSRVL